MLHYLQGVHTLIDTSSGDTFPLFYNTQERVSDEPVNVEDIELTEWYHMLTDTDFEVLYSYYLNKYNA